MNATTPSSAVSGPLHRRIASIAITVVASLLVTIAFGARADVPGRVGRIAFMEGDVQAYSESDPEWKAAYLNQPVTSRNSVFVGDAGRVEISVGSTTLALDAGSQVDIQQLDDNTFNANVVRGRVSMRVRRLDPSDVYNVAVPGADFALLRPGRYRIDALQSTAGITVFEGQASVQGDRGGLLVDAGNAERVVGDPGNPEAPPQLIAAGPVAVPLDDWVLAREGRFRDALAERYVSPNMTGYEDLDANGRWSNEEDVGPVWYPTTYVRADWAPYRYGRWAYVAPWGYTWVDDAPWGFAPFHYGRWVQVGGRWGWTPGAYVTRPVYAPALVGFYGGDGFQFSAGVGPGVGWYPLAPWQRYSPHYTQNTAYITRVNNITIVAPPRRFEGGREWNREHGGTLVPRDAFASQRSISTVAIAAPRNIGERSVQVNVVDLPRPANVPGAGRRGPEGGDRRPEFDGPRGPREFGNRGAPEQARGADAPARFPGAGLPQDAQRGADRGLPSNYQRLRDQNRPGSVDVPADRVQQRGDFPGGFNRDPRPVVQPGAPVNAQGVQQATTQRFTPREQPQIQPAQPVQQIPRQQPQFQRPAPVPQAQQPVVEQQQRTFDRPAREYRNVQQQQPQQPPAQRPQQNFERPQRIERPAPVAPVAPAAPVAAPQPRPQGPPRVEPNNGPVEPQQRGGQRER